MYPMRPGNPICQLQSPVLIYSRERQTWSIKGVMLQRVKLD